jgi:hypothetical protein
LFSSQYGAQQLPKALDQSITQGYGQMNQGYGSVSSFPQFDQQQQVQVQPQVLPLTQAGKFSDVFANDFYILF